MTGVLQPLVRSNVILLRQKIALLDLLIDRCGDRRASEKFKTVCPLVGASIGQHYRHSMDHVELAALVASSGGDGASAAGQLHYDLRVRGGTLEADLGLARKRILDVADVLLSLGSEAQDESVAQLPVEAYFNLSADSEAEIGLPSTVGRELGFAAHHAIHHMFMVRVIAVNTLGLDDGDLPPGFGKAPSTQIFHKRQMSR